MPAAGAGAVIFDGRGRVLLVREGYGAQRWGLPGGHIEHGELPHDAAVREVNEETSLDVTPVEVIGLYRFAGERAFDVYAFLCTIDAGKAVTPEGGEITALTWADPAALPSPMTNIVAAAVPDTVAGRRGVVRTVEWLPARDEPLPPTR